MKRFLMLSICMITIFGLGVIKANAKTCNLVEASTPGQYSIGDKYSCDPGDGTSRTFYILEISENSIYLLMDNVLEDSITAWTIYGTKDSRYTNSPVTANEKLKQKTSGWTVPTALPTYQQIVSAGGVYFSSNMSIFKKNSDWLVLPSGGYWTSTPAESAEGYSWGVNISQSWPLMVCEQTSTTNSIRPVITVSKSEVEVFTSTTDTNNGGNTEKQEQQSQTVRVADTFKAAYIGYLIGTVILVLGVMVLVQEYRKRKKENM